MHPNIEHIDRDPRQAGRHVERTQVGSALGDGNYGVNGQGIRDRVGRSSSCLMPVTRAICTVRTHTCYLPALRVLEMQMCETNMCSKIDFCVSVFAFSLLQKQFGSDGINASRCYGLRWRLRWRLRAGAWRRSCGTESPVSGLECGDPDRHEGWYCIELSLIDRVLKPSSMAPSAGDPPQRCHQRWAPEPEP